MHRVAALLLAVAVVAGACGDGGGDETGPAPTSAAGATTTTGGATTVASPATTSSATTSGEVLATFASGGARLQVASVATGLDTVWSLAWDPEGRLWFTERGGRLTRLGDAARVVRGVEESGEAGLMGLEIDGDGRVFVMFTGVDDNRVVEVRPDGSQRVLVDGIAKAAIHDGGRIRFGADGALYASTGDAGDTGLAQQRDSLNGEILRIDPDSGEHRAFSLGHRNVQGLCVAADGRLLATEHGPAEGDDVNALSDGFNGGWPGRVGNGLANYTPTIAPAGCAVYGAELIGPWKGSMLFVTLKDANLHRLTFAPDGSVADDEVLLDGRFGRLRDVAVGPDGAVYIATSNRDGRGDPAPSDDRILRITPAP